jgi:hypothetical protein
VHSQNSKSNTCLSSPPRPQTGRPRLPNDAEDLIARQRRQLADLEAAWERANLAVRQNFFRRINAEAPELSDG